MKRDSEMRVRLFDEQLDKEAFERWRHGFLDSVLNQPHGYAGQGVETVVVERGDGKKIISLTGTLAVILTPLVRNPEATPLEVMEALVRTDAVFSFSARKGGALDLVSSVPVEMKSYASLLQRLGYHRTAENCVIVEKHLVPPVNRPLEEEQLEKIEEIEEIAPVGTAGVESVQEIDAAEV